MEIEIENNQELLGQEFTTFKFQSDKILSYSSEYEESIGNKAKVVNINSSFPQYAYCEITFPNGNKTLLHYPISGIKTCLEEKPLYLETLINEFKRLIPR